MPGRLALKQLDQLIRKGEVDTVLTVFPDGFGRLMGKRVVGSYFLDHVVDEGAHACIYLFTVDMEMEPLPGFKLTSWERGYGDMKVVPDLGTLRRIPWLPKTALVFCDVYTEAGEPIEEADRAALYKHGTKEIAHLSGAAVTFIAKYDAGAAGSSFHLHSSLWDKTGRKALFAAGAGGSARGGSPLFGHWLAGQLAMARELAYFYAPSVNSYKRYQSGSFAPTRIVAGWDNRTCGFRLCGEGQGFRVENRIPGADANPYLAFAATIAAGLHGITQKLKPPKLYEGNAYADATLPQVPKTLREAIAELERSKVAREAFGDTVVKHYLRHAHLEQRAFDQSVTDWELMRLFERI